MCQPAALLRVRADGAVEGQVGVEDADAVGTEEPHVMLPCDLHNPVLEADPVTPDLIESA